jgi:hypothetical protein
VDLAVPAGAPAYVPKEVAQKETGWEHHLGQRYAVAHHHCCSPDGDLTMLLEELKEASNVVVESMGLGGWHPELWFQHGVNNEPKELLHLAWLEG